MDLYHGKVEERSVWALSTAEAECIHVALSSAAQETVWIRRLISEPGTEIEGPTTLMEDNQAAIVMAKNPQYHGRAKHIDTRHHFIREKVSGGDINLVYCPTGDMVADMLTKDLNHLASAQALDGPSRSETFERIECMESCVRRRVRIRDHPRLQRTDMH